MECPRNQNLQFRVGYLKILPGSLYKEGFNIRSARYDRSKARIGIIGNNENGCRCADSRLGFGTGGSPTNELAWRNRAKLGENDNDNKFITAMGYILVQWHRILKSPVP